MKKDEFIYFMTKVYKSKRTNLPLSTKVASDIVGRVTRIEKVLDIKYNNYFISDKKFKILCELIKERYNEIRLNQNTRKYGYHIYTYAVRMYYKFYLDTKCKSLNSKNDGRYNAPQRIV